MRIRKLEVVITDEACALKELRISSEVSIRKLAELMGISKTVCHRMESGRADVSKEYIGFFLKVLGLTQKDWRSYFKKGNDQGKMKEEILESCIVKLYELDEAKLKRVWGILKNY